MINIILLSVLSQGLLLPDVEKANELYRKTELWETPDCGNDLSINFTAIISCLPFPKINCPPGFTVNYNCLSQESKEYDYICADLSRMYMNEIVVVLTDLTKKADAIVSQYFACDMDPTVPIVYCINEYCGASSDLVIQTNQKLADIKFAYTLAMQDLHEQAKENAQRCCKK